MIQVELKKIPSNPLPYGDFTQQFCIDFFLDRVPRLDAMGIDNFRFIIKSMVVVNLVLDYPSGFFHA